jgi:hypothetical protein
MEKRVKIFEHFSNQSIEWGFVQRKNTCKFISSACKEGQDSADQCSSSLGPIFWGMSPGVFELWAHFFGDFT